MPIHGGLLAESVTFGGHGGDVIIAYQCQPNNPNCGLLHPAKAFGSVLNRPHDLVVAGAAAQVSG